MGNILRTKEYLTHWHKFSAEW